MAERQEPGYAGTLVSLGGFKGTKDRGRQVTGEMVIVPAGGMQLLGANSRRIAALIENRLSSGIVLTIALGDISSGTDYTTELQPGERFQIDYNFPWTGCVVATGTLANVWITEISVP